MTARDGNAAGRGRTENAGAPPGGLAATRPSIRMALFGALTWAVVMALSATACLWLRGWVVPLSIGEVALLYGAGAAIAFPVACAAWALFAPAGSFEVRFVAAFMLLAVFTIGATAAIYAFDYRLYYAAWHDDAFTATWFIQLAYTTAGALGQFAVGGVRLYFPIGFVALLAASRWFARLSR